jgi:hypothetical protein
MFSLVGKPERLWRRVAACVLIYALFLQGLALAFSGAQLAGNAAGDPGWAGFELCHHDDGAPVLPSNAPASPADCNHCILCTAGAAYTLAAPFFATDFRIIVIATTSWPLTVWRLPATTVHDSARPRGPPLAAAINTE